MVGVQDADVIALAAQQHGELRGDEGLAHRPPLPLTTPMTFFTDESRFGFST